MSHQHIVYVVDDDVGTRRELASCLGAIGAEAWPFASGAEFLQIVDHLMPACILLDMEMPQPSGLEVVAELARRDIHWPVIALSKGGELALAVKAMKSGAVDFLPKPVNEATLRCALSPAWTILEKSIEEREARQRAQELVGRLTAREIDISLALLSGQPNKTVAHHLGISVRTVEMHRSHIMAKLGVKSLAEAALLATQAGVQLNPVAIRGAPRPIRAPTSVTPFPAAAERQEASQSSLRKASR